jgi:hypothetical protein
MNTNHEKHGMALTAQTAIAAHGASLLHIDTNIGPALVTISPAIIPFNAVEVCGTAVIRL